MKLTKRVFIGDCHFPYVDSRAFSLLLDVMQDFRPDEVVYLGDFYDMESVSFHDKDPLRDPRTVTEELEQGRLAIDKVEEMSRAKSFVFLSGNHENRIERYVSKNAPKLAGVINTKDLLGLPRYYKYLPYGQKGHYRMGNLIATHGSICGQHPASQMVKKYGCSVIFGHVHKLQTYHTKNIHGDEFVGISAGWLGDERLAAEYIKNLTDWALGFVLTWHKPNGEFFYQIIHILQGKKYECIFEGKVLSR